MRSGRWCPFDWGQRAIAKQKKKGTYRGYDNSVRLEGAQAQVTIKPGCYEISTEAPPPAGDHAFSLGAQGSSADFKGSSSERPVADFRSDFSQPGCKMAT